MMVNPVMGNELNRDNQALKCNWFLSIIYLQGKMSTHTYTGCIILFQNGKIYVYIFSLKCVFPLTIASAKSDLVPAFSRLKSV